MDAVHDHRALTAHRMTTGWDVSALSAGASDVIMALVVAEEVDVGACAEAETSAIRRMSRRTGAFRLIYADRRMSEEDRHGALRSRGAGVRTRREPTG